jgi:hypothetical protein
LSAVNSIIYAVDAALYHAAADVMPAPELVAVPLAITLFTSLMSMLSYTFNRCSYCCLMSLDPLQLQMTQQRSLLSWHPAAPPRSSTRTPAAAKHRCTLTIMKAGAAQQ